MPTSTQFNNNIYLLNKLPKSTNHLHSSLLSETELDTYQTYKTVTKFHISLTNILTLKLSQDSTTPYTRFHVDVFLIINSSLTGKNHVT